MEEAFRNAYFFDESLPTGESARKLQQWIDSKEESLEAISEGIAVGKLQFPEFTFEDNVIRYLNKLRIVARIKIVNARFLMRDGEHEDAEQELLEIFRMGRMIVNGEGAIIHT